MKTLFVRFAKDESGATAIEYGLIATLIGVAIITGATLLGTSLDGLFSGLGGLMGEQTSKLPGGTGGAGGDGDGDGG